MKMQIKKFASLFLCICMALSMLTVASFAAETTATLSFASKDQRTSYSADKQVWEQNGITFTNNKASSTNSVADYANPVRLYAKSEVIIEYPSMTKIVFTLDTEKSNASNLVTSIGSAATAVADSASQCTVTFDSPVDSFTIASLSKQTRFISITVTATESQPEDPNCEHTNTTENTVPTDENKFGSINEVCDDCGEIVNSTPIGATVKYYAFGKEVRVEEGVFKASPIAPDALPEAYADDYTFVGWAKSEVDATKTKPELFTGVEAEITGNTSFYAVYTYSANGKVATYEAKKIEDIASTDVVVITMTTSDGIVYALDNDNGTSSAPTAIVFSAKNGEAANNLKWNIVTSDGSYTIYPNGVTDKWLYCTNTNNGVRVGTNKDNKAFTIDSASGYLKNTATTRYLGVYNNQDWRCYTNTTGNTANQTLGFYVETVSDGVNTYYTTDLAIKGVNLEVGEDLTVNFYVADEYADGTMTFAMNGKTTTVTADGTCFAFKGVAPDCMTDEITATLTAGGQTVGTLTTTVKELATEYLSSENDKIVTFVANMLHYGAESQKYQNDNGDLANEGVTGNTTADPIKVDGIGLTESATTYFKSANVWFSNQNSIIVNLQNLPENAKLIVKKGDDVEFEGAAAASYKTAGLKATELDTIYTFTVFDAEGNTLQSLTYSVNYYAFAMKDNAKIGSLVKALYNYGVSAKELA